MKTRRSHSGKTPQQRSFIYSVILLAVAFCTGCGGGGSSGGGGAAPSNLVSNPNPNPNPGPTPPPGNGTVVAIAMAYKVLQDRQSFVSLAGYSSLQTYMGRGAADVVDPDVRYDDAIRTWRIDTLPSSGTLFDGRTAITTTPYDLTNSFGPDGLLYVPDPGFAGADSFFYRAEDSTGFSDSALVQLTVESNISIPAGIPPLPSIAATPHVDEANFNPATDWYVDNSHPNASDSHGNGSPSAPRMTLPPSGSIFIAGAQVFIRGGTYQLRDSGFHRWIAEGNASSPVVISGLVNSPNKPIIQRNPNRTTEQLRFEGNFAVVEGLEFNEVGFFRRDELGGHDQGNVVIRHSFLHDYVTSNGNTLGMSRDGLGENLVVYDCHVARNGVDGTDHHGMTITSGGVWVLDSLIHHNRGDAIQANSNSVDGLYIGRCVFHSDGENAVDIKREINFVIVENVAFDYRPTSFMGNGSDGAVFLANVDQSQNPPERLLFARNFIFDATVGVRHQGHEIWTDQNIFWHIHNGEAIRIGNNGDPNGNYQERITNNLFDRVDMGIRNFSPIRVNGDRVYTGNIFARLNPGFDVHIRVDRGHADGSESPGLQLDYNHYAVPAAVRIGGTTNNLAALRAMGFSNNGSEGDPLLTNPDRAQFLPLAGSPVINSNVKQITYDEFLGLFGESIDVSVRGAQRPINGLWDKGPFDQ